MPQITEVHWALWYVLVYAFAIVGAWFFVTILWLIAAWRRRTTATPATIKPISPDIETDPELHRFFARVNHAYRRNRVPPHAVAPPPGSSPIGRPHFQPDPVASAFMAEAPVPEPDRLMPDPEILHSAPFYSPRQSQPVQTRRAPALTTVRAAAEADLVSMVNLWRKLSEKDRRELLALARIKAEADK